MLYPDLQGLHSGYLGKCTVYLGNARRKPSNALPGSITRGYYISGYLCVMGTCWWVPEYVYTHVMRYPYSIPVGFA